MTNELVGVCMKRKRHKAAGAYGRPSAVFTEGSASATPTVVKDKDLMARGQGGGDLSE